LGTPAFAPESTRRRALQESRFVSFGWASQPSNRFQSRDPQLGWLSAHVRAAAVGADCVAGIQLGVQRSDVREVPEVRFRKGVCEAAFRLGGFTGARGVRPVGGAPRPSGTNPRWGHELPRVARSIASATGLRARRVFLTLDASEHEFRSLTTWVRNRVV
jgi:hypothetical protein